MSWKEYDFKNNSVEDWLPWGGIIKPNIVKNKDGSYFGVIEIGALPLAAKKIEMMELFNGWCIWIEKQHINGDNKFFIVVCWNPFVENGKGLNSLIGLGIAEDKLDEYFSEELKRIADALFAATDFKILEYQEIIDFLANCITINGRIVKMPDVPLYLDVHLTDGLDIKFVDNDIQISGKKIRMINLIGIPAYIDEFKIYEKIDGFYNYRHVKRMLMFSIKEAKKHMDNYMKLWCPNRKTIKDFICKNNLSEFNGMMYDVIVFLTDDNKEEDRRFNQLIVENMKDLQLPFILEEYNLKENWWSTLPSMFRPNISSILCGFDSINEIMFKKNDAERINLSK